MLKIYILSLLVLATLAQENLQQDFAGGPTTLTCDSTQQQFEAETKRRLDVYTSRASFCRAQAGASVAVIDRCVADAYKEWRRLEKQVEDLIVACDARNPDAPRTCATKVAEYTDAHQVWQDSRTVELTQCYALQDKEKRELCIDLCVERFELKRPLRPTCDTKEGQSCAADEATYKAADATWQAASQKAIDACEGKKDKDECVDRAVVFWKPRKPVAPACSREAVCDREVREYRKQERTLRTQRVAAIAACASSKTPAGVAACQRDVISHYQNLVELLKKPSCNTILVAPDVRNQEKCPAATTWECKELVCRDTVSKGVVSSRCCDQEARANCARQLLADKNKLCDALPTLADRDRCRQEARREATEITEKKACPSVVSFELRLKTLREERDRDAGKCKKADEKCAKDVESRFREQEKQITHDPCFRKSNRCDEDVREYRRAVQALEDERKAAILLCKDQSCREDTRARFTLKRVQLQRPVCDGAEIHLDVSCGRAKKRFKREHDELDRQRVSGLAQCRALPNLEERRKCQDDLIKETDRRRSLIRKPVCQENAREYTCRVRISEYTRALERFRTERSAAMAACKGDAKCEERVAAQFATRRKSLTRPDCAKTSERSDGCAESKRQYAEGLRAHEKKLQTALAACKQAGCREATTKQFALLRQAVPLPKCKPRVSTEVRQLRECDALQTREARQICRNVVIDTRVAVPNSQDRRLEEMRKCRRFTHRTRRAVCEKAVRIRFPTTEHDYKLANDLKLCKSSAQFHECRLEALRAALALCKDEPCRDRERREARRFLTADYRERVFRCGQDLECARKEDDAFFARVHQESSDVRRLRCEAIKDDDDRKADCLEAVRHRHRLVLSVRQCGSDDKCVRAARLQACSEFGDADVKQRCIDRRVTADRLHEARAVCRVKYARSEPQRRACLVEARRAFPAIVRSCDGRIGKPLLRCHRRNAREMRHTALRRQKRALARCKDTSCRSRALVDLLETRALYRRFSDAIRTCSTTQALLKEGTSVTCAADAVKDFELRQAAARFVRRCDRIGNKVGRFQCREANHAGLVKRHCKAEDKECAARVRVLLQLAKEQHQVRIKHSERRQVCNKLTDPAVREVCLRLNAQVARSDNRVERAHRACLEIKDKAASDACVRRALGGPDAKPVRADVLKPLVSRVRSATTSGAFPLWAIGPIAFGLIAIAVVCVVILAFRRARSRRASNVVDSV